MTHLHTLTPHRRRFWNRFISTSRAARTWIPAPPASASPTRSLHSIFWKGCVALHVRISSHIVSLFCSHLIQSPPVPFRPLPPLPLPQLLRKVPGCFPLVSWPDGVIGMHDVNMIISDSALTCQLWGKHCFELCMHGGHTWLGKVHFTPNLVGKQYHVLFLQGQTAVIVPILYFVLVSYHLIHRQSAKL